MRLEGWPQRMDSQPSFETPRKSAAPQDEVCETPRKSAAPHAITAKPLRGDEAFETPRKERGSSRDNGEAVARG
jgi:hypothetical protein